MRSLTATVAGIDRKLSVYKVKSEGCGNKTQLDPEGALEFQSNSSFYLTDGEKVPNGISQAILPLGASVGKSSSQTGRDQVCLDQLMMSTKSTKSVK